MIKKYFNIVNDWIYKTKNQRILIAGVCGGVIGYCVGIKMELVIISTLVLNVIWSD